jgi:hypothetical protein
MPLSPQLRQYRDTFLVAQAQAHRLATPLSHDRINWKPDARTWSVAECLQHLNIVAEGYLPAMEEAAADPDAPRGTAPFRYGLLGRLFVWLMRPDGFKMPTIPSMAPPKTTGTQSHLDEEAVLAAFDAQTERFVALIDTAHERGLDLRRTTVVEPYLPLFRLALGALVEALGQHAVRHVAQAERVTDDLRFPAPETPAPTA